MPSFPADWDTVMRPALIRWVRTQLLTLPGGPYAVIWADQDKPRPDKPYVTLKRLGAPRPLGMANPAVTNNVATGNIDVAMEGPGEVTLEVQLLSDAEELLAMEVLRASAGLSFVREQLEAAGIKLPEVLQVRDLSQLFSGLREWRYLLEVPLRVDLRIDFVDQPWIETAEDPVVSVE